MRETERQLKILLENEELIPLKDSAGVITPAGLEAEMRAQAIKECLRILQGEMHRE